MEVVDMGEVVVVYDDDGSPHIWLSPAGGVVASPRLIEAFTRNEVTAGGLAEAGWERLTNRHNEKGERNG